MIDPGKCVFFTPAKLSKFKEHLFTRVGNYINRAGGATVRGDIALLSAKAEKGYIPIIGCSPEIRHLIDDWMTRKKTIIYWDRGYWFRIFATWLPRDDTGTSGYYRWIVNGFQMTSIVDRASDRYDLHPPPVRPWLKTGEDIVIACPTETYMRFHRLEGWADKMVRTLALKTDRRLIIREKQTKRPLQSDLANAHCLITHGSNSAVEAIILGVPTITDPTSAASLVGRTNLDDLEKLVYPDRDPWLRSLAYGHFLEHELTDGTVFRLLEDDRYENSLRSRP
jgi:hypothetical protein